MTTFVTEDRLAVYNGIEQGTEEWLKVRLGKVTASGVADVLAKTKSGVSASRGNYLIKLALQRTTGVIEEGFTNDAMQWGIDNEAQARIAYEVNSGNFVDQVAFVDHSTIKWFGASPDGLINTDGLVEIKCPNSATHWEYFKAKAPPRKYFIQMQAQMACTNRAWCDFVSFDPRMPDRSKLLIVRVPRDNQFISDMENDVQQFLDEVQAEVNLMKGNTNGN
ncbi:phage_rel_nuc, putative phage-type endonuclease [uncultured Caudovirales phage]|uniref:Phage_rel_nuc, putative phage-type endonuclease n=1 Tax=uncultured Caudovirales phage TaxID=2100421 RepID=A0A6J5KPW3_9CAUD|nr:phage_rel_nuc, putative phage-type endonuclease [uncultured Caudovirales phage]